MPRLTANPVVEANVAFDLIQPGDYLLRIEEITDFVSQNSGNTCWKVRLSYVPGQAILKLDGSSAQNPGNLFDNSLVILPSEKQGKVRSFVEALGKNWGDLDSDELIGLECTAKVGIEEYKGEQKNVVKRYLAPAR